MIVVRHQIVQTVLLHTSITIHFVFCATRLGIIVLIVILISVWIAELIISGTGLHVKFVLLPLKDVLSVRIILVVTAQLLINSMELFAMLIVLKLRIV